MKEKSKYLKMLVILCGTLLVSVHSAVITFRKYDDIKEILQKKTNKKIFKLIKIYLPILATLGLVSASEFIIVNDYKKDKKDKEDDGILFYDYESQDYLTSNEKTMNEAIKKIKVDYFEKGFYSLYDFYKYIGYTPKRHIEDKIWINPNFNEHDFMGPRYFQCSVDNQTMNCYLIVFPEN